MKLTKRKIIILGIIALIILLLAIILPWNKKSIPIKNQNDTRIISYNLKYVDESLDNFNDRKDLMIETLISYDADILALQEANYGWMNEYNGLPTYLDEYSYVGVGREDGDSQGEYASIFYKTDKYEVLESNTIWLSDTPNEVSIGWDASTYRIMTSATFKDLETGDIFTVYNTHLDHIGKEAKKNSIELILETIKENKNPHILAGDFNIPSIFGDYKKFTNILDDSKNIANSSMKHGTINYNSNLLFMHVIRIDYIMMSKNDFEVSNYRVDPSVKFEDKPISDHFPIIVDFKLKN